MDTTQQAPLNQASAGKYRVTGFDQYDYLDYFVAEVDSLEQAIKVIQNKTARKNGLPTSFSDHYFVYDDQQQMLLKATHDEGIVTLMAMEA